MNISIFEIVGPIMLGPSSSGTAGMVRIGAVARLFLSGEPKNVEIQFHPRNLHHYAGCRSHLGLAGGIMGFALDDPRFPTAFDEAKRRGVRFTIADYPREESRDMMRVRLVIDTVGGSTHRLCAVSVGGGNILVESVDEIPVSLNNYSAHIFAWSGRDITGALTGILGEKLVHRSSGERHLYYAEWGEEDAAVLERLRAIDGVDRAAWIPAFLESGSSGEDPLFLDFSELETLCRAEGIDVPEAMLRYEVHRSGLDREKILRRMGENWQCMKQSVQIGISGKARPLYGLDDGKNGQRMLAAVEAGRTLGGGVLGRAVAYGLGVMEHAMSMGCIVAAPTCGSSGIMPGCLVCLQETYGYSDEQMVRALLASTSIGIIMAQDGVRFSGAAAGCQGEITVSAAMAAQAAAYLGGGDTTAVGDAASFAIKGLLGLVCDPMECVEVPCIKRNGGAIAAALAAADMALAGIRSYITPDDASCALKDVQDHLPEHLRGGGGGVACTPAACAARERIRKLDEDYLKQNL